MVTTDEQTQIKRAKQKFGLDEKAIKARIAAQQPLDTKAKKATFVVDNGGDVSKTKAQVDEIFKKLPS